jgi:hypothetical protein
LPISTAADAEDLTSALTVRQRTCRLTVIRRHSVETELVALDVLHHEARLVVAIGGQQSHAYRPERDQSCALGLKCGQALFTYEPGTDPHVKMQPVLDDLAFGNALEEQPRACT